MNKEKTLKTTYAKLMETGFGNLPIEEIPEFINKDVMGYGTAVDEKIMNLEEFIKLIEEQRKQSINFDDFSFTSNPVKMQFVDDGNVALVVDEIELNTQIKNESHTLFLRMTSVFEFKGESWKLIHWHGSKPEHVSDGEDPWHIDEWKKKNAELEKAVEEKTLDLIQINRELEIESSLERVRTVAMGMEKSADLLKICEISFKEFKKLGFEHLRNALIHIPYNEQKYIMDYDFSEFSGGEITKIEYGLHPIVDEYFEKLKKAEDDYFEVVINENQLEGWKEFRQKSGQAYDSRLDDTNALYYYLFSIGIGNIGISAFKAINNSQIKILKRFRNVFDLAYKRYNDIALAEAQAKEAQIQLALERVRARAMAMHKSDELVEVALLLRKEMGLLGIEELETSSIYIHNEKLGETECWFSIQDRKNEMKLISDHMTINLKDTWVGKQMLKFFNSGKERTSIVMKGAKRVEWITYCADKSELFSAEGFYGDKIPERTYHLYKFSQGYIGAAAPGEISKESWDLLKRATSVFSIAYTRFSDLKKAEAQARESQIQLSLERVRARAMAMHHPDELTDVLCVLFDQFDLLGINPVLTHLTLFDEANETFSLRLTTTAENRVVAEQYIDINAIDAWKQAFEQWKCAEPHSINTIDYAPSDLPYVWELLSEVMTALPGGHKIKPADFPNGLYTTQGHFKFGYIGFNHNRRATEEEKTIVERFAREFGRTYQRFLDLKNAEEQTREAQIEASLERVRSVAMSMMKSDELLNVCESVFNELRLHGFNETDLRNSQIVINNDEKEIYYGYQYSDYTGGEIAEVPYDMHPIIRMLNDKLKTSTDAFADIVISGESLNDWKAFVKSFPQKPDEKLNAASELHYYFYSVGIGALGISSFKSLPKDKLQILQRLRNVFNLSYQRYVDISQSEAQAREAQIELALERVRARTIGMQKSEELKEVIRVIYDQFIQLSINIEHTGFIVDYKTRNDMHIWLADKNGPISEIIFPYFDSPHWNSFIDAKEKGLDFFANYLNFEEKNKFYKKLFTFIPDLPEEARNFYFNCPGLAISTILLENVGLYIENFSGTPYSDEENKILMRFGKVFQQTYTRFLDLQKAEAQTREAQIEAALERARAQSMMMQHSEELNKTSQVFHEQLYLLGIESEFSYLWLPDEVKMEHLFWATWQEGADGFKNKQVIYPLDKSEPAIAECYVAWESGMSVHVNPVPATGVEEYFNTWTELLEGVDKFKPELYPDGLYYVDAYMKYGCFGIMIRKQLSEDEQQVLHRFSREFERAYTRFLDLKKTEAQARESQIELSLERIRAQVTAMKESVDLLDIVVTMRTEFVNLGHEAHYFWHMRYLPNKYEKAMTSGDGTRIGMVMTLPRHIHGDIKLIDDWEKSDEPTVVFAMDVETAVDYVDKMISLGDFQQVDPNAPTLDDIRHIGGLTFVMARTSHGEIGYSLPGVVSDPPAEDLAILFRFAGVFDLAYKRFEDLKISEQRNREARIELALERVRARTMAMQKSNELAQTAAHLFSQLNELGIKPYRCNIAIVDEDLKNCRLWSTTNSGNVIPTGSALPLNEHPILQETYDGWKSQRTNHVIKLIGKLRLEWTKYISKYLPFDEYKKNKINEDQLLKEEAFFSNFYFKQGFFTIHSKEELNKDQMKIIQRFAYVFEQTYTRFQDLENAEKQNKIIQAENERKTEELEEARQLQLAMLPKEVPQLSNLDIAVFMKTATEVGGDYYDFHVDSKNNLTAIIGDATGHGMKAGTMVTITKSLFNSLASSRDILKTFKRISEVIKNMKFRQLSMCLQMIKINGSEFSISSAAMPPAFIYHYVEDSVEEILLSGMPLGAMLNYRYKIEKREIMSGDVIFLLSDGLPELHNHKKHMYGYDRVKTELRKVGKKSPQKIIEHFEQSANEWLNGYEQDDDVTFVVIKIK